MRTELQKAGQNVPATVKELTFSNIARCWRSIIRTKYEENAAPGPTIERKYD